MPQAVFYKSMEVKMSDLNRHVRSDKVKWVFTAIAFVLAFVMIIGLALQSFMPDGKKLTDWFAKEEQQEVVPEEGNAIIGQTANNGVKVMSARLTAEQYAEYGVSPLAENAYTLTATVTPATATSKLVDYTAAWADPSSEWANGKDVSDYVTVTQTEDGSLTATVQVLQAFSEQVIVTVAVRDNSSLTATCTVDYVTTYGVECVYPSLNSIGMGISLKLVDIVGTLPIDKANNTFTMILHFPERVTQGFVDKGIVVDEDVITVSASLEDRYVSSSGLYVLTIGCEYGIKQYYEQHVTSDMTYDEFFSAVSELYLDGRTAAECANEEVFKYEAIVTRNYDGKQYEQVHTSLQSLTMKDWSGFKVASTGISLDNTSIIAG